MNSRFSEDSSTLVGNSSSMSLRKFSIASSLISCSQYLESLCDYLYDDLRPRILHEPRLTVLCEVCTVLQALMVLDAPVFSTDSTSPSSDEDEEPIDRDILSIDLYKNRRQGTSVQAGVGRLHISRLLQSVLQDAQTRLFFKAQAMVQTDIQYYVPKPEDLDYPNKLAGELMGIGGDYSEN